LIGVTGGSRNLSKEMSDASRMQVQSSCYRRIKPLRDALYTHARRSTQVYGARTSASWYPAIYRQQGSRQL
jgi:hypothetical protein